MNPTLLALLSALLSQSGPSLEHGVLGPEEGAPDYIVGGPTDSYGLPGGFAGPGDGFGGRDFGAHPQQPHGLKQHRPGEIPVPLGPGIGGLKQRQPPFLHMRAQGMRPGVGSPGGFHPHMRRRLPLPLPPGDPYSR
jgi:hypothetical protein